MRSFGSSESKYLKGDDLLKSDGTYAAPIVTIDRVEIQQLEREGSEAESKFILFFQSAKQSKGLVLNVTNEEMLISLCGQPPQPNNPVALTEFFQGMKVQLYFDPNVKFSGKKVGGLRLRGIPTTAAVPPMVEEPPVPEHEFANTAAEEEVPF
jgi:hypothetical protein